MINTSPPNLSEFEEAIKEMFEYLDDEVTLYEPIVINWSVKKVGFGEIRFWEKDGKIICDNEGMSKEFIKKILNSLVDKSEFWSDRDKKGE